MTRPTSLVGLLLWAGTAHSWPQLAPSVESASIIPYTPVSARSLPQVDESEYSETLHIPSTRQPGLPVDEDWNEFSYTLPAGLTRGLPNDDEVVPGTLTLPIIHATKPGLVSRSVEVKLENRSDVAYYAQLQFGTPSQAIYAQLDTGSFELWVNPTCSGLSTSDAKFCEAVGKYKPGSSSSSKSLSKSGKLNYGIGGAEVDYYSDTIGLSSSSKLKNVRFGVASKTQDQFAGVLGLGHGKGFNTDYPNFLDELSNQKLIDTKSFSVALGSKAEDGGVIVFGGVDTSKFSGKLASLPLIAASDAPDKVARYWVSMESISHSPPNNGKGKTWDNTKLPVFLDTGATLTLLPTDVVKSIAADLKTTGLDDAGFYGVDCSLVSQPGTVDFKFNGVTIKVPYKEIIREFSSMKKCYLGIAASDKYSLLGDTFLRSAYVVFDLDSDTIFMAPYDNCGSSVSKITSSKDLDGLKGTCTSSNDDDTENSGNGTDSNDSNNQKSATSTSSSKTASSTQANQPLTTKIPLISSATEALDLATGSPSLVTSTTSASGSEHTGPSGNTREGSIDNLLGHEGDGNAAGPLCRLSKALLGISLASMVVLLM
ncbi:unnamed protein product [Clonostachys rhizophaga]|uniref:Peptidase A1 domain-containing protein n=1 Tax=Clonostachys rhizophaga TaxID=160324 RepID=A0A9N9V306_9HYPO|nr:unnamed protein product [Clonostachys rhizophaga]